MAIGDEGEGLTPEVVERIFTPGFTTKAGGSGFGLFLARRIVEDLGGTLSLTAGPEKGAVARLELPATHGRRWSVSDAILVAEDEPSSADYLRVLLEGRGHTVRLAANGLEALLALESRPFDLVITDLRMPSMDGFELLSHLAQRWPDLPAIVLTANEDVEDVVEAVRLGAINYLLKPATPASVGTAVDRALLTRKRSSTAHSTVPELVGTSRAMVEVRHRVLMAARSDVHVLVTGATGTGKELVSRAIHAHSGLSGGPFVAHNCALSPSDLFESEFFGHRRGSFTGADRDRRGLLREAHEGVLFLDELETLDLGFQAKLLRVIDDGEVRAVGAEKAERVNVRFVAATNREARVMIEEGSLREDLYYRLRGIEIRLPSLAERREDIPLLVVPFRLPQESRAPPDSRRRRSRRSAGPIYRATSGSCATWSRVRGPRRGMRWSGCATSRSRRGGERPGFRSRTACPADSRSGRSSAGRSSRPSRTATATARRRRRSSTSTARRCAARCRSTRSRAEPGSQSAQGAGLNRPRELWPGLAVVAAGPSAGGGGGCVEDLLDRGLLGPAAAGELDAVAGSLDGLSDPRRELAPRPDDLSHQLELTPRRQVEGHDHAAPGRERLPGMDEDAAPGQVRRRRLGAAEEGRARVRIDLRIDGRDRAPAHRSPGAEISGEQVAVGAIRSSGVPLPPPIGGPRGGLR